MTNIINYVKRKNKTLFSLLEKSSLKLNKLQSYYPIYSAFFNLNSTNYHSVEFTNDFTILGIKEVITENHLLFNIKNTNNQESLVDVFCKYSPLLDPFKYMIGKYTIEDQLYNLPTLDNSNITHSKVSSIYNSSYVDSFFLYLTNVLLNKYSFIHGLNFYGNYLAIKENFTLDVIDDIDYVTKYHFFNKNKNILFDIPHFHLNNNYSKPLIKIGSAKSLCSIESLDDSNELKEISLEETIVELNNLEIDEENTDSNLECESNTSSSNCSSRTSYTNEDENENENEKEEGEVDEEEEEEEEEEDSVYSDFSEEKLLANIYKMPVNIIFMEKCKNTMDSLFTDEEIEIEEWLSILFQIIMILITYQKCFYFTHNDLHTNNIMYQNTEMEYLYYTFEDKKYRVKTYGKIFKIIDFGRSIFKVNDKLFCSDSFDKDGDASTQYNFPPFFDSKKKLLEPNKSFDLCRLACSIFDFIFDDIKDIHKELDEFQKIIVDWCKDDKGNNVLYKNTGEERYEDFKLYRMISKSVHNHEPSQQLKRPQFKKYLINTIPKNAYQINIDTLPILFS
jgi:positive regulator of sigma E activity